MEKSCEEKCKICKWISRASFYLLLVALLLVPPAILYLFFKEESGSVWLGFWGSYAGGVCTLIAMALIVTNENRRYARNFTRDMDLNKIERVTTARIKLHVLLHNICPKFEMRDNGNKVTFNYYEIKNELKRKISLYELGYRSIKPNMNKDAWQYLQDAKNYYEKCLDKLNEADFTSLSEANNRVNELNMEYRGIYAKGIDDTFALLNGETREYVKTEHKAGLMRDNLLGI